MSDEKTRREQVAERVAAAREKILAERQALAEDAPLLTTKLLKGLKYSEEVVVKLKNGQFYKLEIKPLSEVQTINLFSGMGQEKLEKLGAGENLTLEDYDFFWSIVALSSGFDKEDIKNSFAMGESSYVAQRVLEISGVVGANVESFPEMD